LFGILSLSHLPPLIQTITGDLALASRGLDKRREEGGRIRKRTKTHLPKHRKPKREAIFHLLGFSVVGFKVCVLA